MQTNSLGAEPSPESEEAVQALIRAGRGDLSLLLRPGPVGKSGQCQSGCGKASSVYPWVVLNIVISWCLYSGSTATQRVAENPDTAVGV